MTSQRQDLLQALCQIQNHPAHNHHDILTITGCGMSDDEVRSHIEANVQQIIEWNLEQANKPARKRKAA
jgi:Fe2+ or Zn2+ uptake regulation protein